MAPARPSFFCDPNLKEILLGTKEASPNKDNPPYPYGDYFVPFGSEGLDAFTRRIYGAVRDIAGMHTDRIRRILSKTEIVNSMIGS